MTTPFLVTFALFLAIGLPILIERTIVQPRKVKAAFLDGYKTALIHRRNNKKALRDRGIIR